MPPVRSGLLPKEDYEVKNYYVYNMYNLHKSWEAVKGVFNAVSSAILKVFVMPRGTFVLFFFR